MATGHPDYQTWAGRGVSGETIDSYSFTGDIGAGIAATVDVPVVPAGEEHFYQSMVIATPDDTSIHQIQLTRISDGFLVWLQTFVTGGAWDIPGFSFTAGQQIRITVTNNSSGTLDFSGAIFRTIRRVA